MLTELFIAAGLGSAAGQRALLPALLLGGFHHTPWFELSPTWAWLASPPVLVTLGVLALAEVLVDRSPESAELVAFAGWLPKAVLAFLTVAAWTGDVDGSLVSLAGSGLLGAAIAIGTDRVNESMRAQTRELADAGIGSADRTLSHLQTVSSAGIVGAALVHPALAVGVAFVSLVVGWLVFRVVRRVAQSAHRLAGFQTGDERRGDTP